ncbi:hypothetical protein ACE1CI_36855 [Aerosakkonemataceae cyanobacterium BLCC-F50]|uniref:Uncharacterized protein n=1 Tax=Floridaenema flaviceps BLCC-F50 TaxID=3153642 RepID=A0ABV4Y603_9CYAN
MNNCPCCSHQMLRHIRHHQIYWFCRHCWQEMPLLERKVPSLIPTLGKDLLIASLKPSLVSA